MSDGLEVQKCSDFEPKNWKNESVFPQKSMKFGLASAWNAWGALKGRNVTFWDAFGA